MTEADLGVLPRPEGAAAAVFVEGTGAVWLEGTAEAMTGQEEARVGEFLPARGRGLSGWQRLLREAVRLAPEPNWTGWAFEC